MAFIVVISSADSSNPSAKQVDASWFFVCLPAALNTVFTLWKPCAILSFIRQHGDQNGTTAHHFFTTRNVSQMKDSRIGTSIQVIDRAAALLDAIARYQEPVSLRCWAPRPACTPRRHTGFSARWSATDLSNATRPDATAWPAPAATGVRLHSNIDLRAVALPVMEALRDKLGESVNLTLREG